MNRGEIRTGILETLREEAIPIGWTVDELNEYIDDTYREMAERTRSVTDDRTLTCPANKHIIPLPTDAIQVLGLIDDGTGRPIDHCDWLYIDDRDATWARRTSSRPYLAAAWGMHHILIWPAYSATSTITATLAVNVPKLASDAAVPRLPKALHVGIETGALHRALMKDALDRRRIERGMEAFAEYSGYMADTTRWNDNRIERYRLSMHGTKLRQPGGLFNV